MMATIQRIKWATVLGMLAMIVGCSDGDDPHITGGDSSGSEASSSNDVPKLRQQPEEIVTAEEYERRQAGHDSGVVLASGTDDGTGIRTVAAGEKDAGPATINGVVIFEEDDSEAEADAPEEEFVAPKKGTAEYHIHEITKLRLARPPQTKDLEALRAWHRERSLKIIANAEKALALTHRDPKQERIFDVAVRKLLETRLQLAVDGDTESVDALYEHAASLYKRDPKSNAAAEGAFTLTQLAYSNSTAAIMTGVAVKDPRWLQEFARQSEDYAMKFPQDSQRSIPLLFAAAERCEINGLKEEAVRAYSVIAQKFPKHDASAVALTIVRRMKMNGRRIKLSGATLQGQAVSLAQHLGKPVVVFFWNTTATQSVKQIPEITEAVKKYGNNRLGVIGVCLDESTETLKTFLAKEKLPFPNIIHSDEKKRGWNNPIVKFYGVRRVPSMWVIDAGGRVVTTKVESGKLDATLAKVFNPRTATRPGKSVQ